MAKVSLEDVEKVIESCLAPIKMELSILASTIVKLEEKICALEMYQPLNKKVEPQIPVKIAPTSTDRTSNNALHRLSHSGTANPAPNPITARGQRAAARSVKTAPQQPAIKNSTARTSPLVTHTHTPPNDTRIIAPSVEATSDCTRPTVSTPNNQSASRETMQAAGHDENDQNESNNWTVVKNRHASKNQQRKINVGSGEEDNTLKSVEQLKYIQAWSFAPDTTVENVTNFVTKVAPSSQYIVKKRDIKTKRHSSFVIGIPESLYPVLASPNVWPPGVRFTEWFPMRPRHARGARRHEATQPSAANTASAC